MTESVRERTERMKRNPVRVRGSASHISSIEPSPPCIYIGKSVRIHGAMRNWHLCDHPRRIELEIAEVVCSCKGCGRSCKGYEV